MVVSLTIALILLNGNCSVYSNGFINEIKCDLKFVTMFFVIACILQFIIKVRFPKHVSISSQYFKNLVGFGGILNVP